MRYFEIRLDENQAQYSQMLAGMVANEIITADDAVEIVKTARTTFKRNDRIVWWLKWFRITDTYYSIDRMLKRAENEPRTQELKNLFQKITKTNYDTVNRGEVNHFRMRFQTERAMEHTAYQITIPSIEQMVWDVNITPGQLSTKIAELEGEYKTRQSQIVTPKSGDKIVLDYGKYAWVLLNRGACSAEADAMGHCGNVPSERDGDRILSFRSLVDGGRQKPHLTFILNKYGELGEMKGRANQKPNAKYHPYILDLLKQDFIKDIKGGGYEPENNFAIWDLKPEQTLELLKAKPELTPTTFEIDKGGKETIPAEIQPFLADADSHWVLYIKNLIPDLRPLRAKLAYAIVTEPGLTDLSWRQLLTQEDYLNAVDEYGDDAFIAKILKK